MKNNYILPCLLTDAHEDYLAAKGEPKDSNILAGIILIKQKKAPQYLKMRIGALDTLSF